MFTTGIHSLVPTASLTAGSNSSDGGSFLIFIALAAVAVLWIVSLAGKSGATVVVVEKPAYSIFGVASSPSPWEFSTSPSCRGPARSDRLVKDEHSIKDEKQQFRRGRAQEGRDLDPAWTTRDHPSRHLLYASCGRRMHQQLAESVHAAPYSGRRSRHGPYPIPECPIRRSPSESSSPSALHRLDAAGDLEGPG